MCIFEEVTDVPDLLSMMWIVLNKWFKWHGYCKDH